MNCRSVPPQSTYALFGWPLTFSLSPTLFHAAAQGWGLDARYVLHPVPPGEIRSAVQDLRDGRWAGANITVPHKAALRDLVDEESALVGALGAVNTVVRRADGQLRGENTDVAGFAMLMQNAGIETESPRPDGKTPLAVIWGAGGGARAAAYALAAAGYSVRFLARHTSQSGTAAALLHRAIPEARFSSGHLDPVEVVRSAREADLVVNATPVGGVSEPEGSLWPSKASWPAGLTVVDLVAWPLETPLVRSASEAGLRAMGGLDMLVGQAAQAFQLWTGRPPDPEAMRRQAIAAATERDGNKVGAV